MEILDGGFVYNSDTTNTVVIGRAATGTGTVVVDGSGSIWKINDNLTIGDSGTGSLTVSNQGLIDADRPGAIATIGARGRLELDGGTFAGQNITLNGTIFGSGLVRGTVTGSGDSLIDVPTGALLRFGDDVGNQGSIRVRGGEADFLDGLANLAPTGGTAPGRITLEDGRIRFSQSLSNNGVITSAQGANHLHGVINNGANGAIVVAGESVATFYDTVDIGTGSLDILAGANALFLADLEFASGGLATLEIGAGLTGSAQLFVGGEATLAGMLQVELAGGIAPGLGDSYSLLSAASGITGMFTSSMLPALDPTLKWSLQYGSNNVLLEVLAALPGDFDDDGDVDGRDFLIWQRGGSPNGINSSDLALWQGQYSWGSGSSSTPVSGPVPEPETLVLSLLAVVIGQMRTGRLYSGV